MTELKFDFRDLFKAPRLGFSSGMIWIFFKTILLEYIILTVFGYLTLFSSPSRLDAGLIETIRYYEFFPWLYVTGLSWYSWGIFAVGIVLCIAVFLIGGTKVAKLAYQKLKGDLFYSAGDSKDFVKKRWRSSLMAPAVILDLVLLGLIILLFIGILGKIPVVGEIGFSIFSPLFIFGAILIVFFIAVFAVSIFLTPAIVATTNDDVLETVIQLFSTVYSQPWRVILYSILLRWITCVVTMASGVFVFSALKIVQRVCWTFMGSKLDYIVSVALYRFPLDFGPLANLFDFISTTKLGSLMPPIMFTADLPFTIKLSGWILGIVLLLLCVFVASYCLSVFISGHTLMYIILRMKKDSENLLTWSEEEEWDTGITVNNEKTGIEKASEKPEDNENS